MTLIMFVLAVSLAGIFGQILETLKISTNGDQVKAMICGSLLIAIIFTNKANCFKLRTVANLNALVFVFLATIFVIGTAAISRVFAEDQIQGVLTQFNYLGAEDNGAWLDMSKKLLSGDSIPYQSVGGPLIALLAICQSCATFLVYILTGKKNDLAVVLNSVVIAYMVLPIFAAIAFSQITERLIKISRLASLTITSCFWFPIYGSLLMAQGSGHLSFIYVTTVYTCCIWTIANKRTQHILGAKSGSPASDCNDASLATLEFAHGGFGTNNLFSSRSTHLFCILTQGKGNCFTVSGHTSSLSNLPSKTFTKLLC